MECLVRLKQAAELPPVSAELAELHQFVVGDEAQRALAAGQPLGDVEGVVGVVLPPFAATVGQFGGVGDVDAIDAAAKVVDEPLDEPTASTAMCEGRGRASSQAAIFSRHLVVIVSAVDQRAVGSNGHEGDGVLMQIDADERLVSYD